MLRWTAVLGLIPAALRKELALLAAETPAEQAAATRVAGIIASGPVSPDDDIIAFTAPFGSLSRPGYEELGLSLADEVGASDEVLEPLLAYVRGHATGSPDHFRKAFLPTARVEGVRDGERWRIANKAHHRRHR
jgi:hypothetical protein